MFLEASSVSPGATLGADLCVVGAGPAGIAIARSFIGSGARVLVLESGARGYTKSLREPLRVLRQHTRGAQSLSSGRTRGQPYTLLRFSRARAFAGSTNALLAHGLQTRPFDPVDFEERPGMPDSGWPIARADLDDYYRRAQVLCGLSDEPFTADYWQSRVGEPVLPADDAALETTYYRYAPAHHFADYAPELETAADVEVITDATVTALVPSESRDRLRRLEVRSFGGNSFTVEAPTFVIAGGAIENAKLLLAGEAAGATPGLGNEHDLVGRCFMEHPDVPLGFWEPSDRALDALAAYERHVIGDQHVMGHLRLPDDAQRRLNLLNASFELHAGRPTGASRGMVAARLLRRSFEHRNRVHGLGRAARDAVRHAPDIVSHVRQRGAPVERPAVSVNAMTEQEPNPESRVLLDDARDRFEAPRVVLDWRLTDRDFATIRGSAEALRTALADADLGRFDVTLPARNEEMPVFGNWHHMGTTRMAADPSRGVVDADCRVHGIDNLYIAGSSVFPTGGCSNPTLTLVALALRLADHLQQRAT